MNYRTMARSFATGSALAITIAAATPLWAQDAAAPADASDSSVTADAGDIIVSAKATRSATALPAAEIQKILPGIAPLKAVQTLPGVLYVSADPWGNNEQNASLNIHGFNAGQLGYTMDGIPLGDQNYGNFNGLSPQRAVISENVGSIIVSTGAGDLGIASTSNLGGAVETFSSDPDAKMGARISQTLGSYNTQRTYVRVDSGEFGNGNSLYLSGVRQKARAWDFNGYQGGYQANAKFVHNDNAGKLTVYFDYSDKQEPNEDATVITKTPTTAAQAYQPYTRPFTYSDFATAVGYLNASGAVPANESTNYRNYYSDAQRTDYLGYIKYQAHLSSKVDLTSQAYYHHNDGVGVVAGPITVAGLPTLFALYFPGQNLKVATGNSGYAVRTTEYRIDRLGFISTLNVNLGDHRFEAGAWYENNSSSAYRRWYALDVNHPENYSPYVRPSNPLFTQYGSEMRTDVVQLHLQDNWQVTPRLTVEAGFKSSLQFANGIFTVQPIPGSLAGASGALPNGRIDTKKWFLPAVGAKWRFTDTEEVYLNVQKNVRQYQAYGAGGSAAPWSVGSQAAFDAIKNNGKPETSWTYEVGLRTRRSFPGFFLSAVEAQINYYHVDFSNRLLAVSPASAVGGSGGGSISGGTPSLFNVGDVRTNGIDVATTLRFGPHVSLYNALSYNNTTYQSDYSNITFMATGTQIGGVVTATTGANAGIVPVGGKQIPASPKWMNKTVATVDVGPAELQVIGDFVGRRFATYTNDISIPHFFLASLRLAVQLPVETFHLRRAEISLNVTNLFDEKGTSTISVQSNSNTASLYPIPPRQYFGTLSVGF